MPDWKRFKELVAENQRFILTSHVRPDCDALGSELAMVAVLESLGKEAIIVNAFEVPPSLKFLDPERKSQQLGAAGGFIAYLAVGCPVCNKLVLLALGTTGAMQWFAPVQPFLAVVGVVLLAWALRVRLRGEVACPVEPVKAASG